MLNDTKIQYPYNLELQVVQETWPKKQDQDFEPCEAYFEKALLPAASSGSTGPSPSGHSGPVAVPKPMTDESKQQMEKTKVAIQALRNCHSAWDRGKRDWQGVLKQSRECENTRGTKIEADLEELIGTCQELDDKAMEVETVFLTKGMLADADIVRGSELTGALSGHFKAGAQQVAALKPWFML